MEHEDLIVSMKGIQKSFGGVHALTDGELTLRKGSPLSIFHIAWKSCLKSRIALPLCVTARLSIPLLPRNLPCRS